MQRLVIGSAIAAIVAGCGSSDNKASDAAVFDARVDDGANGKMDSGAIPDGATVDGAIPMKLRAEGTAEFIIVGSNTHVECTFWMDLGNVAVTETGWTAVALGGEVFRRAYDDNGPLFEFQALVGGPVDGAEDGDDVTLHLFGEQPDDARPFWLELETLQGDKLGEWDFGGDWQCAPIILPERNLEDPQINAPGSWTLKILPED